MNIFILHFNPNAQKKKSKAIFKPNSVFLLTTPAMLVSTYETNSKSMKFVDGSLIFNYELE